MRQGVDRERWESLAERQPYWTVLVDPRYRTERMRDSDRAAFFESGVRDVSATLATVRQFLKPDFHPDRALDYGCGVGRLAIALARESNHVVGVDISVRMLEEARRNAELLGVSNIEYRDASAFLASQQPAFDFINSYIVFQHIAPVVGMEITRRIVSLLRPGGIGALHYTISRRSSPFRRLVNRLRRSVPGVNALVNVARGRPIDEPMLPVFDYDLAELLALLRDQHCAPVLVEDTQHGRHSGAKLFFRKAGGDGPG